MKPSFWILMLGVLVTASSSIGHEAAEDTLDALNQQNTLSSDQLHQRALAHRSMRQYNDAVNDLRAAIAQAPDQIGCHLELARVQMAAGSFGDALVTAGDALALAGNAHQRAEVQVLIAECFQLGGCYRKSLVAIDAAFIDVPFGEIEWYLLRSESQRVLGFSARRVTGLEEGMKHHPSAVLKSHWIDALLDASRFEQALREIDRELVDRRWQSSYLIKRARALTGMGRADEAKPDLQDALAEIASRLAPRRPDLLLLADQAAAYALLGQGAMAQQSIDQLRTHHAPQWILDRTSAMVGAL